MERFSKNSRVIKATSEQLYNAFTDKKDLEFWFAPNKMTGKIHNFSLKVGSGYEMSLFYNNHKIEGKTADNEDRFSVTFIELEPYSKIIQQIKFQSDKDEFAEEMIMEIFLEEVENNSTKITITFTNIPIGVNPQDNEAGTEQSLKKLAKYLEKH